MNILFWHKKIAFNKALKALVLVSGLFMFADAMFIPIYAIFVEEIGGGITTAANAYSLFWLTAGLLTFVFGKIENKMKERELAIAWSQYIICVAYVLYYFTSTTTTLYMAMFVLGLGNALFWPAFHSLYSQHVDGKKSAWQWSFYDGLAYIVPAVGALVGGYLVKLYGFDLIFLLMAVLTFICGTFIILLPRKIL